jgi:hypothetical protein
MTVILFFVPLIPKTTPEYGRYVKSRERERVADFGVKIPTAFFWVGWEPVQTNCNFENNFQHFIIGRKIGDIVLLRVSRIYIHGVAHIYPWCRAIHRWMAAKPWPGISEFWWKSLMNLPPGVARW